MCYIDEDIEDLANEIAVMCAGYRESDEVRALPPQEHDRLVGDVEQYANKQKHSIRRLLTSLRESHQVFDEIAAAIAIDDGEEDDDDDEDDDENNSDEEMDKIASEDDEDIDDEAAFGEDEDDEDYRTVDALADEEKGDDDEENDFDLDELEEMLTDEECLHAARFEATGILATYEKEMNDIDLPQDTLESRLGSLRRMMFHSADVIVDMAVERFVQSYFAAAMTDIHVRLMETIDDADLASASAEDIASAISEIITVGVVARQALLDLPFTRRDSIENTCSNIEGEIKDIIRHVQMVNSHRPEIADALNDLDINGFYDSDEDSDDEGEDEGEEEDGDEEDDEEEDEVLPPPPKSKSKAKAKSNAKAKGDAEKNDKAKSPATSSKKSSSSSSSQSQSKSKRKQAEVVEPEPEPRRTSRRKK